MARTMARTLPSPRWSRAPGWPTTGSTPLPGPGGAAEGAGVLAGRAAVLLQGGEFAAAGSVAGRALQLSRVAGLPSVQARVLAILGFSRAYLADTEKGSSALVEALAVAE